MIKFPKLKNAESEKQFNELGYTCIPSFLTSLELDALTALYEKYKVIPGEGQGFIHSVVHLDKKSAREFSQQAAEILRPRIEVYFEDTCIPSVSFLNKYPTDSSHLNAHRDGSVLDDTKGRYRILWMPLVDVDENSGALFVLPKSHQYFNDVSPVGQLWQYDKFWDMISPHVATLYVKRGDLIVYDQALMHGSWLNKSGRERPVIMTGITHKDSELLFFKVEPTTPEMTLTAYKVPLDFYLSLSNFETVRDGDILFTKKISPKEYSEDEFKQILKEMAG